MKRSRNGTSWVTKARDSDGRAELVECTSSRVEKAFVYFFQAAKTPHPPWGDMVIRIAEPKMSVALELASKLARVQDLIGLLMI